MMLRSRVWSGLTSTWLRNLVDVDCCLTSLGLQMGCGIWKAVEMRTFELMRDCSWPMIELEG